MPDATTVSSGPTLNRDYNRNLARWRLKSPDLEPLCEGCECDLTGSDVQSDGYGWYCDECWADFAEPSPDYDYDYDDDLIDGVGFADPGGNSALRAATSSNPRNLPCPTCGGENLLTPADRARGYQCDGCADRAERGGY